MTAIRTVQGPQGQTGPPGPQGPPGDLDGGMGGTVTLVPDQAEPAVSVIPHTAGLFMDFSTCAPGIKVQATDPPSPDWADTVIRSGTSTFVYSTDIPGLPMMLKIGNAGSASGASIKWGSSTVLPLPAHGGRFYLCFNPALPAANFRTWLLTGVGSGLSSYLRFNSVNGKLEIFQGAGDVLKGDSGSFVFQAGVLYRVEWWAEHRVTATTGTIRTLVFVGDSTTPVADFTSSAFDFGAYAVGVEFGNVNATQLATPSPRYVYIGALAACCTALPGPYAGPASGFSVEDRAELSNDGTLRIMAAQPQKITDGGSALFQYQPGDPIVSLGQQGLYIGRNSGIGNPQGLDNSDAMDIAIDAKTRRASFRGGNWRATHDPPDESFTRIELPNSPLNSGFGACGQNASTTNGSDVVTFVTNNRSGTGLASTAGSPTVTVTGLGAADVGGTLILNNDSNYTFTIMAVSGTTVTLDRGVSKTFASAPWQFIDIELTMRDLGHGLELGGSFAVQESGTSHNIIEILSPTSCRVTPAVTTTGTGRIWKLKWFPYPPRYSGISGGGGTLGQIRVLPAGFPHNRKGSSGMDVSGTTATAIAPALPFTSADIGRYLLINGDPLLPSNGQGMFEITNVVDTNDGNFTLTLDSASTTVLTNVRWSVANGLRDGGAIAPLQSLFLFSFDNIYHLAHTNGPNSYVANTEWSVMAINPNAEYNHPTTLRKIFRLGAGGDLSVPLGIIDSQLFRAKQVQLPNVSGGAAVAVDAKAARLFSFNVNDGTAFTVSNPTNPPTSAQSQQLLFVILNNTAGAIALSWGTAYTNPTAWVSPAAGKRKLVQFEWTPLTSKWVAIATTADY